MDKTKYLSPREYEMLAILLPDQGEEETKAGIDKMLSYITDEQGTVTTVAADSPWGRRRLAYTVRHEGVDYRDGHYVLVYFTAMPSAIADIERELKLDVNVIRYLLLTLDPHMGEKIDESAIQAEAGEEGDASVAAATEAATEEATDAPADEVAEAAAEETTEAPAVEATEDAAEAPAEEVTEAPAEETTEAPAEEVAEAPAQEEAIVADDEAKDEVAADGDVEKSPAE